jgi:hypothetical protein
MELLSSKGSATSLAANMGEKGMVHFFVRSADWRGFCKAQLIRTEKIRGDISGRSYTLASLSYDKPEVLA